MARRATRPAAPKLKPKTKAEESAEHGGCVALVDGPARGWFWRDWYLNQPAGSRYRDGYVETTERVDNRDKECVEYGQAVVWRFDAALASKWEQPSVQEPLWKTDPAYCACGERLLLILPGRDTCERCRLGYPATPLIWSYEHEDEPDEWTLLDDPVLPLAEQQDLLEVGETLEVPAEVSSSPSVEPSRPSAAETVAFVWSCLAPHYDR